MAWRLLDSGMAWQKFQAICEAHGGLREPPAANIMEPITSLSAGHVSHIDNRRLSRLAKLLGAPITPAAGLDMHVELGDRIQQGQPLFTLHANAPGELTYAKEYLESHPILTVSE